MPRRRSRSRGRLPGRIHRHRRPGGFRRRWWPGKYSSYGAVYSYPYYGYSSYYPYYYPYYYSSPYYTTYVVRDDQTTQSEQPTTPSEPQCNRMEIQEDTLFCPPGSTFRQENETWKCICPNGPAVPVSTTCSGVQKCQM